MDVLLDCVCVVGQIFILQLVLKRRVGVGMRFLDDLLFFSCVLIDFGVFDISLQNQ